MASTTSYSQFIALDADSLWRILGDPSRLPEWHSGYRSVTVDDAIAVGTEGSYVQTHRVAGPLHRRLAPPFTITGYDPGRRLQLTQKEPVGATVIDFHLAPADGGCVVSEKVTVTATSGPVSRALRSAVPHLTDRVDLARLARLAGLAPANDALTVVLAGGSGALGQHLAADLACRGHRPVILTRSVDSTSPFEQIEWDGRTVGAWADILVTDRPVAVVNLAGKLVDCRPTQRNIALLRDSRVDATRALVAASRLRDTPIAHWLQASTTAIWSDAGEQWCTETTPVPEGLPQMTGVARPWEDAVAGANADHLVTLRTSIVLDNQAPAMKRLADLTRVGLGGRVGSGRQWFSWIHVDDWLAIARAALGLDPELVIPDGVVVGASPHPVRNAELMAALRRTLHRPPAPPTPAPLLRLGAIALRTDPALGLTGRRARSQVLDDVGFEFRFPHLDDALADLLGN
ncbi:DUF1731 domain-containing protein [Gordonia sp. HNM0687]|uniref:DUF1731 domain-containing protein n=1 Tax=Gordonia mangrovi TaxID=2665643 RepID=A0A6L7GN35_9ACTN|nr:DUF1731 domain-containing protein [Gordonia mangrovi]MXP21296.1 DUF1731 domain-containing protein [Gordonia mangrovi]UVF80048.1 DUF1731 domain-containing protein [Gordonia mangrovi]